MTDDISGCPKFTDYKEVVSWERGHNNHSIARQKKTLKVSRLRFIWSTRDPVYSTDNAVS